MRRFVSNAITDKSRGHETSRSAFAAQPVLPLPITAGSMLLA
jgi:hypothetical protein